MLLIQHYLPSLQHQRNISVALSQHVATTMQSLHTISVKSLQSISHTCSYTQFKVSVLVDHRTVCVTKLPHTGTDLEEFPDQQTEMFICLFISQQSFSTDVIRYANDIQCCHLRRHSLLPSLQLTQRPHTQLQCFSMTQAGQHSRMTAVPVVVNHQ